MKLLYANSPPLCPRCQVFSITSANCPVLNNIFNNSHSPQDTAACIVITKTHPQSPSVFQRGFFFFQSLFIYFSIIISTIAIRTPRLHFHFSYVNSLTNRYRFDCLSVIFVCQVKINMKTGRKNELPLTLTTKW